MLWVSDIPMLLYNNDKSYLKEYTCRRFL